MSGFEAKLSPLLSRLVRRQSMVVLMLAILALGGYVAFERTMQLIFDDAALINIAGRQRMLSQRITMFALRLATAETDDQRGVFRRLLTSTADEMQEGHRRLLAAAQSPATKNIYLGAGGVDSHVRNFIGFARSIAVTSETRLGLGNPDVDQLFQMAGQVFLDDLDRVVTRFQEESQHRVSVLRGAMVAGLLALGGVLLLSTRGVFRPLVRRLNEELLAHQAAEEQTRLILDSASEGIVGLDRTGKITFVNRSTCHLLGFAPDELIGRAMHALFHHTRADGSPYPADECPTYTTLRQGSIHAIDGEVLWRKDGTALPVKYCSTPIEKSGRLIGAVVTFSDITGRIAAERARRTSEEIRARILDAALDAIITVDLTGRIVAFNRAAEQIFGVAGDAVRGQLVAEVIIPHELRDAHRQGMARIAAGQPSTIVGKRLEMTALHATGKHFPIELAITHIPENGLFTAFIRDLTEQKRAEEILRRTQKMDALGQLTGGIAHDFNNLLGIIVGNLELLRTRVSDDEKALKRIDTALHNAKRGADLTKRLLAFARQDPSIQVSTLCNVNDIIGGMLEMLQRSLTHKVEVRTCLNADLGLISINRGEFEDSLINLVINARDAMSDGGVVTIETSNFRPSPDHTRMDALLIAGEYVVISVSDTGQGIPADIAERIFEPFFTTKDRGKGTGLGLSMVYSFVKRSGGHVRCYSELGMGSTFRLYLPRAEGDIQAAAMDGPGFDPLPRGHEVILVVDDEAHLADIADEYLRDLGYQTIVSADPREAIRTLEQRADIDLLFTDVVMPHGIDGFALEKKLRELGRKTRVLFTSGFTGHVLTAASEPEETRPNLLSKPYSKSELARRVRNVLDRRQGGPAQAGNVRTPS